MNSMELENFGFFFALALWVASGTNSNKVRWRIIEFITVNMMHMEKFTAFWKSNLTRITGISIALANIVSNSLPVISVRPLSNTTLPRRILIAFSRTVENKRFSESSHWNDKGPHKVLDSGHGNAAFVSNINNTAMERFILFTQPIFVFIKSIFAIVIDNKNIPSVFPLVPFNRIATPTLAERWLSLRKIFDGLAAFAIRVRFSVITGFYTTAGKNIMNSSWRNMKLSRNSCTSNPFSTYILRSIKINNLVFDLGRGCSHG